MVSSSSILLLPFIACFPIFSEKVAVEHIADIGHVGWFIVMFWLVLVLVMFS